MKRHPDAFQAAHAGSIPVTRSTRTSLWIQGIPARPGSVQGGVFAVLGRFSGCWGWVRCAVEWLPTGVDHSLGGVSQRLARCVKAGSVKKYGLASKGSAPRQKVWGLRQKVSNKRQRVRSSGELGNAASCFVNLILTFEAPLNNQGFYRQTPCAKDGQRVLISIVQTMRKR